MKQIDLVIPDYLKGFSLPQLTVILSKEKVKQIVAGAGSGKTHTLLGIIEYCLREGAEEAGKILMLSFSRKAVAELRGRLTEKWQNAVEISTFHAFCLRHLRQAYPHALGNIGILTEEKKEKFFHQLFSQSEFRRQIGGIPAPLLWEQHGDFSELFPEL